MALPIRSDELCDHPVAVLTHPTTVRGLAVEVPIDDPLPDLPEESVVNCDGLHTLRRSSLTAPAGALGEATMHAVCRAVAYALGC